MYIRKAKVGVYLLYIDSDSLALWSDYLGNHLEEASWCCSNVQNIHARFDNIELLLYLKELECTPRTVAEFFRLFKVRIVNDKRFWHIF